MSTPLAKQAHAQELFQITIRNVCKNVCANTFNTELFIIDSKYTIIEDWLNKLAYDGVPDNHKKSSHKKTCKTHGRKFTVH